MKKLMLTLITVIISVSLFAQTNFVGKWTTVDDETGDDKSIVEIFKKADGKYYGKIVRLLQTPANANCVACKGNMKNKPLLGLEIIQGLKYDDDELTGGTITDPKSGKSYKCTITRNGDKLNVRGYMGFSLLGRTQTWKPAK